MAKELLDNREKIIEELTDILMQLDKDCNQYQTDVYLYYDAENRTAELDTFVNVGGNSWLDDDHYTIYISRESFDRGWDNEVFSGDWTVQTYCDELNITKEKLLEEMIANGNYTAEDEMTVDDLDNDFGDVMRFIRNSDKYSEMMEKLYCDWINDNRSDYVDNANMIIDNWENEYEENS